MAHFLSLVEYAAKYHVSISTLRRRIKSNLIEYKKEHGRYFIPDQELNTRNFANSSSSSLSSYHPTNESLDYTREILKLKNEIVDLKTLVSVLEDEIKRLKGQ